MATVAYGDSFAYYLAYHNPGVNNRGSSGTGLLHDDLPPVAGIGRGDAVVVSIGWNDVRGVFTDQQMPASQYRQRLVERLDAIRAANGGAPILLLGLEPTTQPVPGLDAAAVRRMNRLLQQVAAEEGIGFLDLAARPIGHRMDDGWHYDAQGSQLLYQRAMDALDRPREPAVTVPSAGVALQGGKAR